MYKVFAITGGTGFIGKRLTSYLLNQGYKVYVLTRKAQNATTPNLEYIEWNPSTKTIAKTINEQQICVVHLAGAGVADKRWNVKRKQEIKNSRVDSTSFLYELMASKKIDAAQVISASAIGYYAPNTAVLNENDAAGNDYLATTCIAWEAAIQKIRNLKIPVSILRIGIVLGVGGGAIAEFIKPIRFGIAGIPGNGKQLYSCVHIDDIIGMIMHCGTHQLDDVYNAVAPEISTCRNVITTLAQQYCNWFIALPSPSFFIKILLGEMSTEILKSASISGEKIIKTGYQFLHPTIESCMKQIVSEIKKTL
jgi:uncharacterized protein